MESSKQSFEFTEKVIFIETEMNHCLEQIFNLCHGYRTFTCSY